MFPACSSNFLSSRRLLAALPLLWLSSCATLPDPATDTSATQPDTERAATAEDPSSPDLVSLREDFTPELLFHMLVAEVAGQRKELALSSAQYRKAAALSQDPRVAERAMRIAVYARRYDDALEAAQRWLSLAPSSQEAWRWVVVLAIHNDRDDVALERLEGLLGRDGDVLGPLDTLVKMLTRPEHRHRFRRLMQTLIERWPARPEPVLVAGRLALEAGDHETALQQAQRALELRPGWDEARLLQAQALIRTGSLPQALDLLAELAAARPEAAGVRLVYARALILAKRLEEAREQFRLLAEQSPDNGDLVYAHALMLMETGQAAQARAQFERLLELGQRVADAHYYLGRLAGQQGDLKAAASHYRQVTGGEHVLDAQLRLAEAWARSGQLERGRKHLRALRRNNPALAASLYEGEARLLQRLGENQAAMALYEEGLKAFPEDRDLKYGHALLAEKLGRLDVLERELRDILDQNPDDAGALNALGYTLADRGLRLQEALGYIQRAYARNPEEPAILDSMGWVHYRLGRLDEAVDYLRRALDALFDPEIAAHLGEVLWVKGDRDAARKVWQRARKAFPDDDRLKRTIERLQGR